MHKQFRALLPIVALVFIHCRPSIAETTRLPPPNKPADPASLATEAVPTLPPHVTDERVVRRQVESVAEPASTWAPILADARAVRRQFESGSCRGSDCEVLDIVIRRPFAVAVGRNRGELIFFQTFRHEHASRDDEVVAAGWTPFSHSFSVRHGDLARRLGDPTMPLADVLAATVDEKFRAAVDMSRVHDVRPQ